MKLFIIIIAVLTIQAQSTQNGDHEIFIMQTANTMNQGQSSLTSLQLLNFNFNYGVMDDFQLGTFFLPNFTGISGNNFYSYAKYKFYHSENLKFAVQGTYKTDSESFMNSAIASYDFKQSSVNFSMTYDYKNAEFIFSSGSELDLFNGFSILLEYSSSSIFDSNGNATIEYGLRYTGESILLEAGLYTRLNVRTLNVRRELGSYETLPLVKFSYYFN